MSESVTDNHIYVKTMIGSLPIYGIFNGSFIEDDKEKFKVNLRHFKIKVDSYEVISDNEFYDYIFKEPLHKFLFRSKLYHYLTFFKEKLTDEEREFIKVEGNMYDSITPLQIVQLFANYITK